MSPQPFNLPSKAQQTVVTPEPSPVKEEKEQGTRVETQSNTSTIVIKSELDSYVSERIKEQPKTIASLSVSSPEEINGQHRMSLPDYFEKMSYDCTRGDSCHIHNKDKGGNTLNPGKYVFRWIFKNKQAIDYAMDVRRWRVATPVLFRDAQDRLFTANGAVERGDSILMFMTYENAKFIREAPGKRSIERLKSRMTQSKTNPRGVLMTGDPSNPDVYEPDLSNQATGTEDVGPDNG